jgi:ATP-binding cassette subfamily F protein 3
MITLNNISKNYGNKILFQDLSLSIYRGEKIGLIGPNGAGKSTIFSIILGEIEPSAGSVQILKDMRIGYLPQEAKFLSNRTVLSELTEGDETIAALKKEKEMLESRNEAATAAYGEILHQLETMGYFELEYQAKTILMGLGFRERDFTRPITELSGGWQMRTLLGKLLTFPYDILLLDEPTNYLDLNAALWLKDYLQSFRGTFLMISHDKAFLNEVTNYTLIIENGNLFKVQGNYEQYQQIKEEKRSHLIKQFKEQEKKRKQLEEFIARFHAQPNKASAVRAKRTVLERMVAIQVPQDPRESIHDFNFPPTRRSGHRVITLRNIAKAYGDIQVYKDFSVEVTQGEKVVLAGENGAGKSTLLKILAGVVQIDSGERIVGHNVDIGYFSQTRMDVLHEENTVLQEAYSAAPGYMSQETIRTILGAFLFTGEDSDKQVRVLSGGEKSRLILAKLLINPPNLLLLDEPTTHLDVDAVDALVQALTGYAGTIVFISHDIHFVRSIANNVYEIKEGKARKFPGSFDYYLEKRDKVEEVGRNIPLSADKKVDKKKEEEIERAKQKDIARREQEKKKNHNKGIKEEIKKLKEEMERLNLEHFAKQRAVSHPRSYRDEQSLEEYIIRLQEIDARRAAISEEIRALKRNLLD